MSAPAALKGRYFYNPDLTDMNFTRKLEYFDHLLETLDKKHREPKDSPSLYMGSTQVDAILPGYRQQNDLDSGQETPWASLWMGDPSIIAAHYDVPDNLACNLAGQRRFTLFPPEQIQNLYPGPVDFTPAGQVTSLVDFSNPDDSRFPLFKQALEHAVVAELAPGDVLYIPSMWWHHVEALSAFNLLQNYWWRSVPVYAGNPADVLLHALLAIKDLPRAQKEHWKALFEYYIFDDNAFTHIPDDKKGVLAPLDQNNARKLRGLLLNKLNR